MIVSAYYLSFNCKILHALQCLIHFVYSPLGGLGGRFSTVKVIKRLFYKIKLFSSPRKELFYSFYDVLGFFPRNIGYYRLAVRHRSKPLHTDDGALLNNERLEFLGDSVLNSVVSDILYHQQPNEQEGFLTNARSRIVKRETLNELCVQIGLNKLIVATRHLNLNKERNFNILGNTLEALVGAIYLDYGYYKCKVFVEKRLFPLLGSLKSANSPTDNPKSQVIEWCQKYRLPFDFILIDETVGANNQHNFLSQLEVAGVTVSRGSGASKKESQQNASIEALLKIESNPNFLEQLQNQIGE